MREKSKLAPTNRDADIDLTHRQTQIFSIIVSLKNYEQRRTSARQ